MDILYTQREKSWFQYKKLVGQYYIGDIKFTDVMIVLGIWQQGSVQLKKCLIDLLNSCCNNPILHAVLENIVNSLR